MLEAKIRKQTQTYENICSYNVGIILKCVHKKRGGYPQNRHPHYIRV